MTADAAPSQFVEDPFRFYELCFTTEIQEEDGDVRRAGGGGGAADKRLDRCSTAPLSADSVDLVRVPFWT